MAENVFRGHAEFRLSGFRAGPETLCELRASDSRNRSREKSGELFVRSPHSIVAYEGGEDIRDEEGYYATGDIGFVDEGEVVITGRKQDLANIGGARFC